MFIIKNNYFIKNYSYHEFNTLKTAKNKIINNKKFKAFTFIKQNKNNLIQNNDEDEGIIFYHTDLNLKHKKKLQNNAFVYIYNNIEYNKNYWNTNFKWTYQNL